MRCDWRGCDSLDALPAILTVLDDEHETILDERRFLLCPEHTQLVTASLTTKQE